MDSPETLATLGTRHRTLEKTVEGNDEWTVQRHWKTVDIGPETLATLGTRHVRENCRGQ